MRITTIENVRSGDVVKLECNGKVTYHLIVLSLNKQYEFKRISQEEYLEIYNAD